MLFMFGCDLMSSFRISIAGRSPTCLPINTVLSAVIFGKGTGAKLIFASTCRPLCETRDSIVVCKSVVMEKFPLFRSHTAVRKQLSLVCEVWKISSCVGFGSVLSFGLNVIRNLVVLVPLSGGGGASRVFHARH